MLEALRRFVEDLAPEKAAGTAAPDDAVRLATAVLFVEVMRADGRIDPTEHAAVENALRERFALSDDEAKRLAELACAAARNATDFFAFTSLLDERFDMARKIAVVESMWRVAYADGTLGAEERHVLWRVSDLLHVPQGAYVNARLRAERDAAGSA
jgi:uncharacterized tellurite resistance protein B-like protein